MPSSLTWKRAAAGGVAAGAGAGLYALAAAGALTLDVGWGRSTRPLGPFEVEIAAKPEVAFDVVAAPYQRTPRAMAAKLTVLERGTDMVLAAHRTSLPAGLHATTVETVRFERPDRITFRLARGPVPDVRETFELRALGSDATVLTYRGELSADLWMLGRVWGAAVARKWEATVAASLDGVRAEAERIGGRPGAG